MASVTGRIKEIKQPRGGYIRPSEFEIIVMDDGIILNSEENVHCTNIGMVVDYMSRFIIGNNKFEAFKYSIKGAICAAEFGFDEAIEVSKELITEIIGLDDKSIINACKLVTFDVWYRNPLSAIFAKRYEDINPDNATIHNIQTLIKRSVTFFEIYGPITKDGFSFEPVKADNRLFKRMMKTGKGSYGGYTSTVSSGDGDFLTDDTLWDFKVSKTKPTNKHTLQLLMYWIMGLHSGQEVFKNITKLGLYNPRLNTVYLLDISKISCDIIEKIEDEVICYER